MKKSLQVQKKALPLQPHLKNGSDELRKEILIKFFGSFSDGCKASETGGRELPFGNDRRESKDNEADAGKNQKDH